VEQPYSAHRTFRQCWETRNRRYDVACAGKRSTYNVGSATTISGPDITLRYIWAYQVSTSADGHRRRRRTSTHRCREVHTSLLKYDVHITHYICRITWLLPISALQRLNYCKIYHFHISFGIPKITSLYFCIKLDFSFKIYFYQPKLYIVCSSFSLALCPVVIIVSYFNTIRIFVNCLCMLWFNNLLRNNYVTRLVMSVTAVFQHGIPHTSTRCNSPC